jgi:hypothetical protein
MLNHRLDFRQHDETSMTICTSSSIRTLTVGSGFAPDLLTPLRLSFATESRDYAGARGLATDAFALLAYRRWGISPRPEDALICRINRLAKHTTVALRLQRTLTD